MHVHYQGTEAAGDDASQTTSLPAVGKVYVSVLLGTNRPLDKHSQTILELTTQHDQLYKQQGKAM